MMNASGIENSKLSIFTLALLEDTGFYQIEYSNEYSDSLTYGYG